MNRRAFLRLTAGLTASLLLPGCGRKALSAATPLYPKLAEPPHLPFTAQPAGGNDMFAYRRRADWGAKPWQEELMSPMAGICRLTVHHEGSPFPNRDDNPQAVAATLRRMQEYHRQHLGAGDIAYHYIIDRAGEIWEGRSLCFQGAHVLHHNEHNLGIMVLGNFDLQEPTVCQIETLCILCQALIRRYRIPAARCYGHCELAATRCPGERLKPQVARLRA